MTTERSTAGAEVPAVQLTSISKSFGAIVACDRVDLTLRRGRIHGILGENGAGKSTLMKVLIGLVLPDGGSISVDGKRCQIRDPHEAAELGIGMVHQHFSLVEPLTVWENVILGDTGRFDAAAARQRVAEISERYGLGVDADARVGDLPAGVRQRVEIIKCLRRDPSILIFDEPTSVLTPAESERLFKVLRRAVLEENRAVALVSHKLNEVLHATDEVTIMRAGAVVKRMETAEADAPLLARAMVGREVSLRSSASALGLVSEQADTTSATGVTDATGATGAAGVTGATGATGAAGVTGATSTAGAAGVTGATDTTSTTSTTGTTGTTDAAGVTGATDAADVIDAAGAIDTAGVTNSDCDPQETITEHDDRIPVLRLRDVVVRSVDGRVSLNGLNLSVFDSEIVGVAGVEGNGQTELVDLLSSLLPTETGTIEVGGTPVDPKKPGATSAAGVAVIPEDRHDSGCVLNMTVAENLFLVDLSRIARNGIYNPDTLRSKASELIAEFDIHAAGPDAPFWSLSGGNQQRVVLARELSSAPRVLVAAQPTHGLDVGAIEWMTNRLRQVADSGVGVLLISSELEEILELSNRIVVLFQGRIVGEVNRADVDLEELGLLMGGAEVTAAA